MKAFILGFLIYFSGCFISYCQVKHIYLEIGKTWNVGNRYEVLAFSMFSWVTVVSLNSYIALEHIKIDLDAPANW